MTPHIDPLIVDAYAGDFERRIMDWNELAAAGPPWSGVILKATQGTYYSGGKWFRDQWPAVRHAGMSAGRTRWLRGAYHYFDARIDGAKQADYFIGAIDAAGGVLHDDVLMVDVERANQRGGTLAHDVVVGVTKFTERLAARTGHACVLYGGSWLRDLDITSRMGCKFLAIARYTATLPAIVYERIGWNLDSLAMWQYCGVGGDGKSQSFLAGYPSEAPGCGPCDISALVLPGGVEALIA